MRLATSTVRKLLAEIDRTVEVKTAVVVDVYVLRMEISWGVDYTNLTGLHEVVGDSDVLLVRSDFDVMRANEGLDLIRVIQALDVVQIANIQSGNVVSRSQSQVQELAIAGEIRTT